MTEIHGSIPPGERVGDYQIVGRIGAGGMGVVYKAVDLKLDRTVALKFLPHDLGAGSAAEKERFLREAKTASSLDHTNIGVIHGIEETADGHLFIVMAYYEGETLAQKIRRGPLGTLEALDLAMQVARGLGEAHSRSIIHRDIKPSNVIVTRQGLAKIVDFGLARMVATSSATQSVGFSGTVGYMSPEQALNKPLDQRTDLWALGVTLAEMLTARNPFHRDSPGATMLAILHQPPTGFEQQPAELQAILYRAMAKDQANRYESAGEMLGDLERVRASLAAPAEATDAGAPTLSLGSRGSRRTRELEKYLEQATGSSEIFGPARKGKWKRWVAAAAAIVVLAASSLLVPAVRNRVGGALFGASVYHVAVLPFQTIGGGASDALVAEGLMQSLTGKLSNLEVGKQALWVVPASVVSARKVNDPAAALRELGATVVVQGSIEREGQDVHLTINLIDTKTLRQIGSAQFEDPAGDLSTLQNEAVSRLANLMGITMTPAMLKATGGRVQPAAYESYLKGLGYLQRYDKPGNIEAAISALQAATNADPQFALGYAELGEAYRLRYEVDRNPQWIDEATANCNRALHMDDHLPAVYVTLASLHSTLGKYDLALQEFQHALQLDPQDATAVLGIAFAYEQMGRTAEAEAAYKRAVALRPDDWNGYNSLGLFYDRKGKYQQAIAEFQKAIQLTPDNPQLYFNLGAVYVDTGDVKEFPAAETALKKSLALGPSYPAYANLGYLYLQEKRFAESAAMTEKALQLNNRNYLVWANLALAYEWLGEKEKVAAANERKLKLVEAAVQKQPQAAELHAELGLTYAALGLHQKATAQMQTALALSPNDPQVLADAGEMYEDLGGRARAIQFIERALEKGYPLTQLRNDPSLRKLLADPNFRPMSE